MTTTIDREGRFKARLIELGMYEQKKGSNAVNYGAKFQLTDARQPDGTWEDWSQYDYEAYGNVCVVKREGDINERGCATMRDVFGLSPDNGFAMNGEQPLCQVTIKVDEYEGKTRYKVAYIDAYDGDGGSGNMKTVGEDAAKAALASSSPQMRAFFASGSANTPPPADKPKPPPPSGAPAPTTTAGTAPPPKSQPPAKTPPKSTFKTAWAMCKQMCANQGITDEGEIASKLSEFVEKHYSNVTSWDDVPDDGWVKIESDIIPW